MYYSYMLNCGIYINKNKSMAELNHERIADPAKFPAYTVRKPAT